MWYQRNKSPSAGLADGIPSLPNYAQALEIFNKRTPYIRGAFKGKRPLGSVRRYWRSLISNNTEANCIECSYYGTNVVTFYSDGRIALNTGGYPTISTMGFMQAVLRDTDHKFVRKYGKLYYCDTEQHQYLNIGHKLTLHPDGHVEGAYGEQVHDLNKSEYSALRKKYSTFLKYGYDMLTMSQEVFLSEQDRQHLPITDRAKLRWHKEVYGNIKFMQDLDFALAQTDADVQLQIFFALLRRMAWSLGRNIYRAGVATDTRECSPDQFKKAMHTLLKLHYAGSLFTPRIAGVDKPVFDSNLFYVRFGKYSTKSV